MKKLTIVVAALFLCACASRDARPLLDRTLGNVPASRYMEATTIEEIRALRPQAEIPLRIAVMPPDRWNGFSKEERQAIQGWGEKFIALGFAKSVDIVPVSLVPECSYRSDSSCYLYGSRVAGARLGADAILFVHGNTVSDSYINPLSVLDLTIVGMWLVPGHHVDTYAAYEASLFDIDNGYLYAVAEAHGEQKLQRPFAYIDYQSGQSEAIVEALNSLGEKLMGLAQEQVNQMNSPNNLPQASRP